MMDILKAKQGNFAFGAVFLCLAACLFKANAL